MKTQKDYSRLLYVISLCLIIIPAGDLRKDYSSLLYWIGIIILLVKAGWTTFINNNLKYTKNQLKVIVAWILVILCLFPGYVAGNISIEIIIENIFLFFLYFLVFARSDLSLLDICFATVVSNMYFAYRCFVEIGTSIALYQGTVTNPNQMALILMGGIIGAFYIITESAIYMKALGIFSLIVSYILLFFTSCRSVMLATVIAFVIYLIFYLREIRKVHILSGGKVSKKFLGIFSFCVLFVSYLIYHFRGNIINFLFEKWGTGTTTALSGRNDLWNYVLRGLSLTGNYTSDVNTNNDFLDWLLKYGVISFIAYIGMLILCIGLSLKLYKENKRDNIWYIIIISAYIFVCMFENVHAIFGKSINIMFWYSIGLVMKQKHRERSLLN